MANGEGTGLAVLPDKLEQALVEGDLSRLSIPERVQFYKATCESMGLSPLTKPFGYIVLNGKLTLYALKACTDQLRKIHGVSIGTLREQEEDGIYTVFAPASDKDGRTDEDMGSVTIANLKGEALCNAKMKAATKAKRRVTLSICGLGWLDETEVTTIPGAKLVDETSDVGRPPIAAPRRLEVKKTEAKDAGRPTDDARRVPLGGGVPAGDRVSPRAPRSGRDSPRVAPGATDDLFPVDDDPAAAMRDADAQKPPPENTGLVQPKDVAHLMAQCREHKVSEDMLKAHLLNRYGLQSRKDIARVLFPAILEWVKRGGPNAPKSHARTVYRRPR